jgi:hypothetical protein
VRARWSNELPIDQVRDRVRGRLRTYCWEPSFAASAAGYRRPGANIEDQYNAPLPTSPFPARARAKARGQQLGDPEIGKRTRAVADAHAASLHEVVTPLAGQTMRALRRCSMMAAFRLHVTAHPLGWSMLAASIIPIGDGAIVLRHGGCRAVAFGVHGVTAAVMLIISGLLLFH